MTTVERDPDKLFAEPNVHLRRRTDGTMILRSRQSLGDYRRCIGDWLEEWAGKEPDRPFLLERGPDNEWTGVTYSQALGRVRRIGSWLLGQDRGRGRPVAILSDNSVEHALISLAAMHVGIPAMPISPAYSLISKDFGRLRTILSAAPPGVIYAADGERFAAALAAIGHLHDATVVLGRRVSSADGVLFSELLECRCSDAAAEAFAAVGPQTVAKLLFTSGSTGSPKGVINSQQMLCANQQQMAQVWPFTDREPPTIVDWLPRSHTFGGNHNFNLVLRTGGTMYIDGGRPLPGIFEKTTANLREIAPTAYFNVPRGYDMLITALRTDSALRDRFFSRLQLIFYAAAALPQNLWDALGELAMESVGTAIPMVSAWGSTETAPLATSCHFQAERAGVIGVPVPGCELKLVPNGEKLEVRVRGPNVTPGYWNEPDLTARSFDEEGYYQIGDAVTLVDEDRPNLGLFFDGRVTEDFKLLSGTWVNTGALRVKAIAALAPVAQDVVVTGQDRDSIGLLIFPNVLACRQLCSELRADAPIEQLLSNALIRDKVRAGLVRLRRDGSGSSTFATRAYLMADPPSIDTGEITDKGYINQRAVLTNRQQLVELLHAPIPSEQIISIDV